MNKIQVHKKAVFTGHRDCIYAFCEGETPNLFYTSGSDKFVVGWDLEKPDEGKLIAKVDNTVYALCYLPQSNILIVGQNFEGIHFVDLATNKEVGSLKLTDKQIFDIKVFEDKILVGSGDGTVYIISSDGKQILHKLNLSDKSVRALAVHEERRELAVAYSDHKIRIADLDSFIVKNELEGHENSVFAITYSPNGDFLLSGSRDATLKIWDVKLDYKMQESIVAHMYTINNISFRPDGKYFVTCSKDKSVKIWDGETFRLLKVIDKARHAGHGTSVNKVSWPQNDGLLLSCSDDRSISIWELEL